MVAVKLTEGEVVAFLKTSHPAYWHTIHDVMREFKVGYSCARMRLADLVARGLVEKRRRRGKLEEYRWTV